MGKNLNRDVKNGMAWSLVERGGVQFLNFVASVILARLLVPSDFGVLGLAVLFTGVSGRVSNLSFGMAIVQRDEVREDHLATLFATQSAINTAIFLGLVAVSPFAGRYFGNPLVGTVLAVSSTNFLIRCLGVVPSAMLRRGRGFKYLSMATLIDEVVNLCVAVPMAFMGFGVWALVAGNLSGGLVSKLYLVHGSGWRPSLKVSKTAFHDLFGFGMGVSIAEFITYTSDRTANFVIGKVLGTAALGYYDKGYSLMSQPLADLGERANRVLFPVFARIRNEAGRFRAAMRRTILSISLISVPLFCSLAVLGHEIVYVLFGSQWEAAVRPFQILCIAAMPKLMLQLMIVATFVTGSSKHEMKRRSGIAVLTLAGSFLGVRWGLPGIATALLVVSVVGFVTAIYQVERLGLLRPFADVIRPQLIPCGAAVVMVLAERACQVWIRSTGVSAFIVLPVSAAVGGATYLGVVALMRDAELNRLIAELRADLMPLAARMPMPALLARRLR
jgi:PST family polysaccharide transporter